MTQNFFGPLRPLVEGSRVALVAPSGLLRDPVHVQRAVENTESMGWVPVLGEHVSSVHAYFAGTDDERTQDLNEALRDDTVDAICSRSAGCVSSNPSAVMLSNAVSESRSLASDNGT